MADVFYTILIVWVLWRIFGGTTKSTVHHHHTYEQQRKQEGEVTVSGTPQPSQQKHNDSGEYVDFEEVK